MRLQGKVVHIESGWALRSHQSRTPDVREWHSFLSRKQYVSILPCAVKRRGANPPVHWLRNPTPRPPRLQTMRPATHNVETVSS